MLALALRTMTDWPNAGDFISLITEPPQNGHVFLAFVNPRPSVPSNSDGNIGRWSRSHQSSEHVKKR